MASGRLGKADLSATTNTLVYTVPALKVATVNIRIANRNSSPAVIRVAITEGGGPSNDDYVTFNKSIGANEILEETGLLCTAGEEIYIYSNVANVSTRVHGFEEAI